MSGNDKRPLVPRLRFSEFRDAGGWSFQPLKKLAKRSIRKNTGCEIARVLTNSAEYGVVDQRDFFDKDIANQGNLEGYYIVEEGAYVYNPRISATAPVGPISKNRIGTGVMSPLYTVFKFDNSQNEFYSHYFKSTHWHQYMRQSSSTGARHDRMSITNDDFMGLPLPVSTPEEQQKIADCLSSLDDLITAEIRKLDTIKAHKKGMGWSEIAMHFWLTSATADFERGEPIKIERTLAHFGAFSCGEDLAAAISRITDAPLLWSTANVGGPSTDSTGQTASSFAQHSWPIHGSAPWCSQTAA